MGGTRRRGPYPEPLTPERRRSVSEWTHTHRQPRWPIVSLCVAVLMLTAAVVVLTFYVVDFQAYVAGRGQYRDRQAEQIREQVRQAACDVLNSIPADPDLDPIRARYRCGPLPMTPEEKP